mgnify:CR=1 FL=1|jgi:DNA-nicking Smr family endonuclease|tara:strand:+ start:431 stop:1021 length:591 start_codon:yes stop_codon:yes gene_type:complete
MTDDNDDFLNDDFLEAMGDVKPLMPDARAPRPHHVDNSPGVEHRRLAAAAVNLQDNNILSGGGNGAAIDGVEQVQPQAELQFRRNGIQDSVYRKLRSGKYTIEARLDLHHSTVDQARGLVYQFVRDCREHDIRCALITHGKGEGRDIPALLKSCVAHWLPQMDEVLAIHSARQQHGGSGATYVLLRKSKKSAEDFL